MSETLLWALKVVLAALLITPFVGATGCSWISHWYKTKAEFMAQQAKAQSGELKMIAERMKNDNESN